MSAREAASLQGGRGSHPVAGWASAASREELGVRFSAEPGRTHQTLPGWGRLRGPIGKPGMWKLGEPAPDMKEGACLAAQLHRDKDRMQTKPPGSCARPGT